MSILDLHTYVWGRQQREWVLGTIRPSDEGSVKDPGQASGPHT